MPTACNCSELWSPNSTEQDEPTGGHRFLFCELQGNRFRRRLPGKGMGKLLQGCLRLHLHGQHYHSTGLVQLGRSNQRNVSFPLNPKLICQFSFVIFYIWSVAMHSARTVLNSCAPSAPQTIKDWWPQTLLLLRH